MATNGARNGVWQHVINDLRFRRVSTEELERRWGLLRSILDEEGLDALVALGNEDDMSGYVRWITDDPVSSYRSAVVFSRTEGITLVEHGNAGGRRMVDPRDRDHRGVKEILTVAAFQSAHYTLRSEAEAVIDTIRRRDFRRIGLVGHGNMPYQFVCMLHDGLAERVDFVEITDAVDAAIAVKSVEEQTLIREAAALQDEVFSTILQRARPGMRDVDVTALAWEIASKGGGAGGVILAGSAAQGEMAPFRPPHQQNRVIQRGDYLSLLIENGGPSGHFTELARTIVFGTIDRTLRARVEEATALQKQSMAELRAGVLCADAFAAHKRQRQAMGHEAEDRIFAHGQGYHLVERPLVRSDEPLTLSIGMNLAVHPTLTDGKSYFAVMCDNFLIGEDGQPSRLHRTEQTLFQI